MNKLNTLSITELKIRMTACIDIYERKRIEYADCYNPNFGMEYRAKDIAFERDLVLIKGKRLHAKYKELTGEVFDWRLV